MRTRRTATIVSTVAALAVGASACTPEDGGTEAAASGSALEAVSRHLTRDLTPALARGRLGPPDVETGSGLIIYKYRLQSGDTLALGFPGHAPITYAQLLGANGTRTSLPLR